MVRSDRMPRELWSRVGNLEPGSLAADEDVLCRSKAGIAVERACRQADPIAHHAGHHAPAHQAEIATIPRRLVSHRSDVGFDAEIHLRASESPQSGT